MKYQGKTIEERTNLIKDRILIGVEISDKCNNNCSNCNVALRLRDPKTKINSNLVNKIIKHTPKNSLLLFVGLGEPLMSTSQERIYSILKKRKDLIGFVQTNGLNKLNENLVRLIEQGRLEIGLSYDEHHFLGGQKNLKIQPEYVECIVSSTTGKESLSKNLNKLFPSLNRILIAPLLKNRDEIIPSWIQLKKLIIKHKKQYLHLIIYTEWDNILENKNKKFSKDLCKEKWVWINKEWKIHPEGFYIYTGWKRGEFRILTNGKILEDIPKNRILVSASWEEIEKHSRNIEDIFNKKS